MALSSKVNVYHSNAGDIDVPCIVLQGYDVNGAEDSVEGNVVNAYVLLLGESNQRLTVAKGTDPGEFSYSA